MTNAPKPLYSGTIVQVQNSGERAVHVLRGIDLDVQAGEVIALFGPSGSGKTTLLNLIGALDTPTQGKIVVGGQEVSRMGEGPRAKVRRKQIGFIFQNYTLMPTYSAQENVDLALRTTFRMNYPVGSASASPSPARWLCAPR
jgi:putative ABC transport system ATP-binding protein